MTFYTFKTFQRTKPQISEPKLLSSFYFWSKQTKDNLLPHNSQPQLTHPQSSFNIMDNSTGRSMSMLAYYNLIFNQSLFLNRDIPGFTTPLADSFVDMKRGE